MLTKRMFWTTVATATAAAGVIAWLMIEATKNYPYKLVPAISPTESIAPTIPGPPQPTGGTVGKAVGLHLRAAIDAIKRREFANAQSLLTQAEAVPNKTLYENFKIGETWAYLYGQQKNYKGLLKTYEVVLADANYRQFLTAERSADLAKQLPLLALTTQDYPKAIEHSQRWLVDYPDDADMRALLGKSFYSIGNYQSCDTSLRTAFETAERSNTKPNEAWLTTLQFCAVSVGDIATADWALERLCRYYPKADYWKRYIRDISRNTQSDLASFYASRLELDAVGTLDPTDYTNLVHQENMEYGLPSTALRTLQQAFAQHVVDSNPRSAPRVQTMLARVTEAAAASRASIPALVNAFPSDPTAQNSFALGLVYFDNEQYADAIKLLAQALENGRLKDPGHARMTLGIAHLKTGNREAARTVFTTAATDPVLDRIAHAWIVRTYN